MSAAHTPGPWVQDRYGNINDKTGSTIRVQGLALSSGSEAKANASLIAASPELVSWLKWSLNNISSEAKQSGQYDMARAAIAKATGEQA